MTTVFDIPAELLIRKVAEDLKDIDVIQAPSWAEFVKTGAHKQMPPENTDWWHLRAAAVLRRVYVDGPVGVERIRTAYGGARIVDRNPTVSAREADRSRGRSSSSWKQPAFLRRSWRKAGIACRTFIP